MKTATADVFDIDNEHSVREDCLQCVKAKFEFS